MEKRPHFGMEELDREQKEKNESLNSAQGLFLDMWADDKYKGTPKYFEQSPVLPKIPEFVNPSEVVLENLKILSFLNGHKGNALRNFARNFPNLNDLVEWKKRAINGDMSDQGVLSEKLPEMFNAQSADELFERLTFLSLNKDADPEKVGYGVFKKSAEALGVKKVEWAEMRKIVFGNSKNVKDKPEKIQALLEKVGFIDLEQMSKGKGFDQLPAEAYCDTINTLRVVEEKNKKKPVGERAIRERSKILNALLASEKLDHLRNRNVELKIDIDVNGLLINGHQLDSHLPYGLISNETIAKLESLSGKEDGFISKEVMTEIKVRKAANEGKYREYCDLAERQVVEYGAWLSSYRDDHPVAELVNRIRRSEVGNVLEKKKIVPDLVIEQAFQEGSNDYSKVSMLQVAERLTKELTNEKSRVFYAPDETYKMVGSAEKSYNLRKSLINDSSYYNVNKIARGFLDVVEEVKEKKELIAVRGRLENYKDGDINEVLEVLYRGSSARILLNKKRALNSKQRAAFESLPGFSQSNYVRFEDAVKIYENFSYYATRISNENREWGSDRYSLRDMEKVKGYIVDSLEHVMPFVLANMGKGDYANMYEKIKEIKKELIGISLEFNVDEVVKDSEKFDSSSLRAWKLVIEANDIVGLVSKEYGKFLYDNLSNPEVFEKKFVPEIKIHKLKFGKQYLEEVREVAPAWAYDEKLSLDADSVRIAEITLSEEDLSTSMPVSCELDAIEAIHLQTNRPMIVVVGGARFMDSNGGENKGSAEYISRSLLKLAHENKANLCVPGTQSGLGNKFGEANVEYRRNFSHLSDNELAFMWGITPKQNICVRKDQARDEGEEVYGVVPMNQIATDNKASWHLTGLDKLNSPYLRHAEHSADIISRTSSGQEKVLALMNGGLYSIVDAEALMNRGFPLVIYNKTGRLAESVSTLFSNLQELSDGGFRDVDILKFVNEGMEAEARNEFLKKDFGFSEEPENDTFAAYRIKFKEFLKTILDLKNNNPEMVRVVEPEDAVSVVESFVKKENKT